MSINSDAQATREYTIPEMVRSIRKLRGLDPKHRNEDSIPTEILSALFHSEDDGQVLPTKPVSIKAKHRAEPIEASFWVNKSSTFPKHRVEDINSLHALVNS